ncbi:hypothetical protein [Jeotgalibacillus soli]|uniref:Uncharacterized protein n=1 Tax=Jeotgalibacillus soli TaxID=889306 RepID=A0A0C2R455_9BACL|nr:hypothetical protein [Jeotgalibacillus soli]KIL45005.1 hypothetical protein KP78_25490 [Jeotgalibacillus soli]
MVNKEFETIRLWMEEANSINEKIDLYEKIIEEESQPTKVLDFLKKEIGYLKQGLDDLFTLVKSRDDPFSNFLILKYFEGYTIEEAALSLNLVVSSMRYKHADFTRYMKDNKKPPVQSNSEVLDKIAKSLNELLNPRYVTCCEKGGQDTGISREVARKIFLKERRKELAALTPKRRALYEKYDLQNHNEVTV